MKTLIIATALLLSGISMAPALTYEECLADTEHCRVLSHGMFLWPGDAGQHSKACPAWATLGGYDTYISPSYWPFEEEVNATPPLVTATVENKGTYFFQFFWHYIRVFCTY